ncbi:MAG: hypothetical protein ACFE85_08265 [Candidatus Hodarchaeota archaeon]
MKVILNKKKNILLFFTLITSLFVISSFLLTEIYINYKIEKIIILNQQESGNRWFTETYTDQQWIQNSDFADSTGWLSVIEGDSRDVSADITAGEANLNVIGENYTATLIYGTPNSSTSLNWYNTTNSEIPVYPTQGHGIDENGCFASHLWAEHDETTTNAYQKASVHWEKIITTPHNMSDYTITSASLEVLINATVKSYIGCGSGDIWHWEGVEAEFDDNMDRFIEGDYIKFYVRVSNLAKDVNYKIAEYQNATLGQDGARINGSYDYQYDQVFEADNIDDLIFYLNQVLENGDFQNFIIVLGIEYNCEDNCSTDLDEFTEAYIKSCNFTISYTKKINQFTSASWRYLGEKINNKGGVVEVTDANLFFDYKINQDWPFNISPNSEIRIIINNREHTETIKLIDADITSKPAKTDGLKITTLIPEYEDINVSLQLFIADGFDLDQNYTLSLDNVLLYISYNIFFPARRDTLFQILLIVALISSGILATYFIYYRRVLRFPKQVRKVRKYRKTLNKPAAPSIQIKSRKSSFESKYSKEIKKSSGSLGIGSTKHSKTVKEKPSLHVGKKKISKELIIIFFIIFGLFTFSQIILGGNSILNVQDNSEYITLSQEDTSELFKIEPRQDQLIKNSNFDTGINWSSDLQGDISDLDININNGYANYILLGESGNQVFNEDGTSSNWTRIDNDDGIVLPDYFAIGDYGMDQRGWYSYFLWPDNAPQSVKVQWRKNFTMNVNMTDYYITSASLAAWINGTAQATSMDNGGIDRPGDILVVDTDNDIQVATGDFIRYFIMISDLNRNREFIATQYQTDDLGKDGPPAITQLNDTPIMPINEETLIFYLEQALQYDYKNFAITLGMYYWCEDSGHPDDIDNWQMIIIKNFTLSISYEKKINQFNTLSWTYNANKIDAGSYKVEVTGANLNFGYMINQYWPTNLSPNSKFRIFINNFEHNETIRLSNAELSLADAKPGGFDVTKLIPNNDTVNLTIQVYLADEFRLANNITISIDNVILRVNYNVFIPVERDFLFQLLFAIAAIGAACLTIYIVYYQKVLKYPKPVRKVRKYRKALNKTALPDISITNRETAFQKSYQNELKKTSKFLKGTPVDGKILREKLLGKTPKEVSKPKQ